ncbi:thioesterase II family protein [Pseudoxanthomonas mexicana]|uniref:thioesterase II family protein n=1 Tax=Pseudoxanthomonas mexicana TaxID=128785 RepID=UPI00398AE3F2
MTIRLKCLAPRPMARTRLLCVPFAGAGAGAYRGWADALPAHVETYAVQLPAREDRLGEAPYARWRPMMEALTAAVAALPMQPTVLFGHSLGALIAFELARWMQAQRPATPRHLFVSGRPWPGGGDAHAHGAAALSDEALLEALDRRYGSLATSLSHPEIRELVAPILRADVALLDSYAYQTGAPLDCPITMLAGRDDPTTPPDQTDGWRHETRAAFASHVLEGGHFFIEAQRKRVLEIVGAALPVPG